MSTAPDWQQGGFGLYLHWPFCQSKCPYCDFNSHVAARIDQRLWRDAFLAEIARAGRDTSDRILDTVFFGGGTPSLMDPDLVAAILDAIRSTWRTSNSFEVTLEANPSSIEAARFRAYRDAGVNRVSMGMQAMNDDDLRALGRLHSAADALRAFDTARATFDRVSFDLIYARQHQTPDDWRAELDRALALGLDHLSLYQLTIEDGTAFGARHAAGKLPGLPDDDRAVALWDITQERTQSAGLPAYEISNHARPGAESRHNLIYWRSGDWLGIGPGAHGRLTLDGTRYATETPRAPGAWLDGVSRETREGWDLSPLPAAEHATEFLLMGLRLTEGVDLDRYDAIAPRPLDAQVLAGLAEDGMIELDNRRLRTTSQGRLLLNAVLRALLVDD
jgi:putative oxygen-independent coproporphyrinogen III oxidase